MRSEYILEMIKEGKRIGNRALDEFRKIEIETNLIKKAEGSARVKLGDTDVIVGVKLDVGEPFKDTPDEGILITSAEFTPIASPEFEPGPPGEDAIELARVVDRGIREGEAIDLKKLCIKEGEKVWIVFVDIHILNHMGNLLDASALASMAALLHTKIPKYEDGSIIREESSGSLPILHKPITVTVGKIYDKLLVDLLREEEEACNAKLSIAVREDDKICAMQKSGELPLTFKEVEECIQIALKKSKEIRKLL
jgi:exosome complex component RRP42